MSQGEDVRIIRFGSVLPARRLSVTADVIYTGYAALIVREQLVWWGGKVTRLSLHRSVAKWPASDDQDVRDDMLCRSVDT